MRDHVRVHGDFLVYDMAARREWKEEPFSLTSGDLKSWIPAMFILSHPQGHLYAPGYR